MLQTEICWTPCTLSTKWCCQSVNSFTFRINDNVNNTLRGQSASKRGGGVAWASDGKTAEVSQLTAVGWKVVEVISAESGAQSDTNPHSQLHPLLWSSYWALRLVRRGIRVKLLKGNFVSFECLTLFSNTLSRLWSDVHVTEEQPAVLFWKSSRVVI